MPGRIRVNKAYRPGMVLGKGGSIPQKYNLKFGSGTVKDPYVSRYLSQPLSEISFLFLLGQSVTCTQVCWIGPTALTERLEACVKLAREQGIALNLPTVVAR